MITDEFLLRRIADYTSKRNVRLAEKLGSGFDGVVFVVVDNVKSVQFAAKIHRSVAAFRRERDAYLRLKEHDVSEIHGFSVPQILASDEAVPVIEMTIVDRPFVLDFASAWLDDLPEFTEDPYGDEERRERFGERWPVVQRILGALRAHGIFMLDISPSNIAFRD